MGFFDGKETHVVDGRKVVFIGFNKVPRRTREDVKRRILEFCRKEGVAKRFPVLECIVPKRLEGLVQTETGLMAAKMSDVREGKYIVLFEKWYLSRIDEVEKDMSLEDGLAHELTHLWHASVSGFLKRFEQKAERLTSRMSPAIQDGLRITTASEVPNALRITLTKLFFLFFEEGLASFYQRCYKEKISFSEDAIREWYALAMGEAKRIRDAWNHIGEFGANSHLVGFQHWIADLNETFFERSVYIIGVHMVHAICMRGADWEEMLKWSDLRFIREYEKAARELGLSPIVSRASDSLVCYNGMLSDVVKLKKRLDSAASKTA